MSVEMALRLEAALGVTADFWLKLQLQWDLWIARKKITFSIKKFIA